MTVIKTILSNVSINTGLDLKLGFFERKSYVFSSAWSYIIASDYCNFQGTCAGFCFMMFTKVLM